MPKGVELTKELVQKVVGAWVNMNLANQEFVRASVKFEQYANPNETPLYQFLEDGESNAERFNRAFQQVQKTITAWNPIRVEGYAITIIR